jgi:hypothetical protein
VLAVPFRIRVRILLPTILSIHSFLFSPLLSRPLYHFASLSSVSPSLSLPQQPLSLALLLFRFSNRPLA